MGGILIVFGILNLITGILNLGLLYFINDSKIKRIKEARTDAKIEEAREEKKDVIDEGFENIMSYSVNGKTGFEVNNNGN